MLWNYVYGFLAVFAVSLVSLVGVFTLALNAQKVKRYTFALLSLAAGALLGDAFIHLIPESVENLEGSASVGVLIILGIIIFFIIEKFLHWHHHEDDTEEKHASGHVHPVGKLIIFSDGVHNMLDGIVIGASFLVSIPTGIATTLAVILHEIPQEVGDFAVLLHAGYSKARALWLNFLSALSAFVGLSIAFIFGSQSQEFIVWILPLAAGGFIYIAVADLIPELHKTKKATSFAWQIFALALGVGAMFALALFE